MPFSDCRLLDTLFFPGPCTLTFHSPSGMLSHWKNHSHPGCLAIYSSIKIQLLLPLMGSLPRQRDIYNLLVTSYRFYMQLLLLNYPIKQLLAYWTGRSFREESMCIHFTVSNPRTLSGAK